MAAALSAAVEKLGATVDSFTRFTQRISAWGALGALKGSVDLIDGSMTLARQAGTEGEFNYHMDLAAQRLDLAQASLDKLRAELAAPDSGEA